MTTLVADDTLDAPQVFDRPPPPQRGFANNPRQARRTMRAADGGAVFVSGSLQLTGTPPAGELDR